MLPFVNISYSVQYGCGKYTNTWCFMVGPLILATLRSWIKLWHRLQFSLAKWFKNSNPHKLSPRLGWISNLHFKWRIPLAFELVVYLCLWGRKLLLYVPKRGVCCPKMCFRGNDRKKIIGSRALQTMGSSWLGVDNRVCNCRCFYLCCIYLIFI